MTKQLFLKGIEIDNFKSFNKFTTNEFGQINLITGKNNSGKTSLLEAIYLNLGPTNPNLWLNINVRRGLDRVSPQQSTAQYLFHKLNISKPLKFKVHTHENLINELVIKLIDPSSYQVLRTNQGNGLNKEWEAIQSAEPEKKVTIELTFTPAQGNKIVNKAFIENGKIEFDGDNSPVYRGGIFLTRSELKTTEEEIARYDKVNKANELNVFENTLKVIEPKLIRTSLGMENDRTMIYADVGYGLMPLSTLGAGSGRLSSILLSLASAREGIVLVDEIENGFHYSLHEKVWSAIGHFVKEYKCQFFATTHSKECIESAIEVFGTDNNIDFRLHRLDKKEDKTQLFTFDEEQIKAAIETGWEVR